MKPIEKFSFSIFIIDSITSDICIEDRLFEAGCDDSLMCTVNNEIYLEFTRDADNLDVAIQSAQRNIESAGCKPVQIFVQNYPYIFMK